MQVAADKKALLVLTTIVAVVFLVQILVVTPTGLRQWLWITWLSITLFVLGSVQNSIASRTYARYCLVWGFTAIIVLVISTQLGNLLAAYLMGCWVFLCAYLIVGFLPFSSQVLRRYWIMTNVMITVLLIFITPDVNRVTIKLKNVAVPTHFSWQKGVDEIRASRRCAVKYFVNHSPKKESFSLCAPGLRTARDDILIRVAVARDSGLNILSVSYSSVVGFKTFLVKSFRKTALHDIEAAMSTQRKLFQYKPLRVLVLPVTNTDPAWLKLPDSKKLQPPLRMLFVAVFAWQIIGFGFLLLCPLYQKSVSRVS